MKVDIKVARDFGGNNIDIHVEADNDQLISRVLVNLDGFNLADDQLDGGTNIYDRNFPQAGEAGPGTEHRMVVSAFLPDGTYKSATKIWKDLV